MKFYIKLGMAVRIELMLIFSKESKTFSVALSSINNFKLELKFSSSIIFFTRNKVHGFSKSSSSSYSY